MGSYVTTIGAIITIVGAVATGVMTFRRTREDVSSKTIEAYKARVDLMAVQQTEMQKTIKELSGKVSELTGIVREKDDRIRSLEGILQGKNPEMEGFMQTTIGAMNEIKNFMQLLSQKMAGTNPLASQNANV